MDRDTMENREDNPPPLRNVVYNKPVKGHCPREFLSNIPHPLPAAIGMSYFHFPPAVHTFTGEAPFPNTFIPGVDLCPPIFPQDMIHELRRKRPSSFAQNLEEIPNSLVSKWENERNQYPARGIEEPEQPRNQKVNEPQEEGQLKRIWPFMGFGKLDIREKEDSFVICLDVPGLTKDCIDVSLRPTSIVVECIRKPIPIVRGMYHYFERPKGKLVRTIQLPCQADPNTISCSYIDGVLTINIGKLKKEDKVKKVHVQ